eukprot:2239287-Rhodomonas_salina.1
MQLNSQIVTALRAFVKTNDVPADTGTTARKFLASLATRLNARGDSKTLVKKLRAFLANLHKVKLQKRVSQEEAAKLVEAFDNAISTGVLFCGKVSKPTNKKQKTAKETTQKHDGDDSEEEAEAEDSEIDDDEKEESAVEEVSEGEESDE